jgi:hypothetical protein
MNDAALHAPFYASWRSKLAHRRVEEPGWTGVHRELKRNHVTSSSCETNYRSVPGRLQLLEIGIQNGLELHPPRSLSHLMRRRE